MFEIINGDCIKEMKKMESNSVDSIVTDPPYNLTTTKRWKNDSNFSKNQSDVGKRFTKGFMGKEWDGTGIAFDTEIWEEALRVAKPGAHLLAFGSPRTYHRMACAIEDAGWEIRDTVMWLFLTGFPKSQNISKMIDKKLGVEQKPTGRVKLGHEEFANRGNKSSVQSFKGTLGGKGGFDRPWMDDPEKIEAYHMETEPGSEEAKQWVGWGSNLKPAYEPVILARKKVEKTIAENVLKYGTGGLNIDECRINPGEIVPGGGGGRVGNFAGKSQSNEPLSGNRQKPHVQGRWPTNIIFDEEAGKLLDEQSGPRTSGSGNGNAKVGGKSKDQTIPLRRGTLIPRNDTGGASRFFYCPKQSKKDRNEGCEELTPNNHPTVKATDLMRYLCRLITPPNGIVLDPFMGSGSTGKAAILEGFRFIGIEKEKEYVEIAKKRISEIVE